MTHTPPGSMMPSALRPEGGAHDRPEIWGGRLARILGRQVELYRTLDELSQRQSSFIEEGETESLIGVLAQRQVVVDQLASLNDEMQPMQAMWRTRGNELPAGLRDSIRGQLDVLASLVGAIQSRDAEDGQRLEREKARIQRELEGTTTGRTAVSAYGRRSPTADPRGPRYQDRNA